VRRRINEGRKISPSVNTIQEWWELLPLLKGEPSPLFPESKLLPSRTDMINRGQDLEWWKESERCEQARAANTADAQQGAAFHNAPSPANAAVDTPLSQEEPNQLPKAPELLLINTGLTHSQLTQHEFLTGPDMHLVNTLHGSGVHVIASRPHRLGAAVSGTSGSGVAVV
jgi:hypothetical protein